MGFQINPVKDIPEDDAKLLGHDKIIVNLKTFLEQQNMITPLSIAIHGDWGSGKTSIMKTLSKKLNEEHFEIVFFEAWKYEYANPSLGLISELTEKYAGGNSILIQSILRAALHILSNQFLGLDSEEVIKILRQSKQSTETLSKSFHDMIKAKIGSKMLIIIIDDLDRCDVENTLQLLAIIKLFLDIENCVCIAAVDFNRLKQAWRRKYGIIDDKIEDGSEYLDKIFQIRIGIPRPPPDQIQEYLKILINEMPDKVAELFSKVLPKNPRAIKRILNLISYRRNLLDSYYKDFSAIFWTLLEEIIGNTNLISMYDRLIANGGSLDDLIIGVGDNWQSVTDILNRIGPPDIFTNHAEQLKIFLSNSHTITQEFRITRDILNRDFKLLYDATNEALR
ncbi:MAG: hypothetical protein D4R72_01105 [Nitrosopumilales archaeon]|nr:MAG: hypothetical protein D4R72_01105 [Nitrosopumilales archaeon]